MKVFLASSFRPQDKELVGRIERLLASHDVTIATGERLGGEVLTPAIKACIDGCDGLVGVLTRRDQIVSGGWTTHAWVQDEIAHARSAGKKAVALVEDGVTVGGMYQPNEHLVLRADSMLDTFLDLSETLALWRAEIGRLVKVQILPQALALKVGADHESFRCRHRLGRLGRFTEWSEVPPVPEVGGTFVYVPGVGDDHLIQLEVSEGAARRWRSLAASQWIQVELTGNAP